MKAVAIIPARGGSRRIPRKNVRDFNGRPMISWAIGHALEARIFDRVIVSTDDDEIATAAEAAGAEVPFRRPANLADDTTATAPVIAHAITQLGLTIDDSSPVCCIYPATPLLEANDLRRVLAAWHERPERFALTGYAPALPITRAFTLDDEGAAKFLLPEFAQTRTQDLPRALIDVGWCYIGSTLAWTDTTSIIAGASVIEIPTERAVDIDSEDDWQRALDVVLKR